MRAADDRSEAVPASGLQRYFRDARSWDQDRIRNALRSTRIAWSIAAIASLLAAASIFAVAALPPLQPVVTRSEERRVGQSVPIRVDLGGRRILKKTTNSKKTTIH